MTNTREDIVLKIHLLTKTFGKKRVLDQVSFEVERGTFVSLIGPSGSGKTTCLRSIAGLINVTEGEILLNGERINEKPPYKRDVTTVFQHYGLFPHMDVFENVAFGLLCRKGREAKKIRNKVMETLELVKLTGYENRNIHSLSGGEQQRIALARSLVTEPSVLLLDEPLGALDLKLRRQMGIELKNLHDRLNMTFLYVTHDQEEALSMSDQVVVIHQGKIQQTGSPRDLFWRPKTVFVAEFIGEANILSGILVDIEEGIGKISLLENLKCTVLAPPRSANQRGLVHFSIKAEAIALGDEANEKSNRFTGTIEDSRFYGVITEYITLLPNGQHIKAKKAAKGIRRQYDVGDTVLIGWDPEDAVMLISD